VCVCVCVCVFVCVYLCVCVYVCHKPSCWFKISFIICLNFIIDINKFNYVCFSVAGPKLWNALPLCVREELSITLFKKRLKSYLMLHSERYFQVVNMK